MRNDEWEEVGKPTDRRTATVAEPMPAKLVDEKTINHAQAIESHLLTLQKEFEELKHQRTHFNSRLDEALAPIERELDAIDAAELAAIMESLPVPADVHKRRADCLERRANIRRDAEIEADTSAARINSLATEIERASKGFEKTGGTPSMLRERKQHAEALAKSEAPVKIKMTVAIGSDHWHGFIRAKLVTAGTVIPREGEIVSVPGTLAKNMIARGWATETE
ncbi:MAG: hypothetical protein K8T91_25660 [Planctomycetes bacterium]|nr:hypothetical protein [Planctomycetota bacterium]